MTDSPDVQVAETGSALGIGAAFQAAREAKKFSLEDVSNRLRLSVRQIRALESEDFSVLPESAITRGFIRNYARLLEIDAAPLLDAYKSHVQTDAGAAITLQSENILISSARKSFWAKYIIASAVIVIALIAWMIYMDYFHESSVAKPVVDVSHEHDLVLPESTETEPLPQPALPAAEREGDEAAVAGAITGNDAVAVDKLETTPVPAAPVVKPAESVTSTAPVVPTTPDPALASTVVQVSEGHKNVLRLRLTVTDATWVSVIDPTDREIVNRTIPAGGVQRVESLPPLKLVIGNAEGARLTVNDKAFDLVPYTRLNVARVTLE